MDPDTVLTNMIQLSLSIQKIQDKEDSTEEDYATVYDLAAELANAVRDLDDWLAHNGSTPSRWLAVRAA